MSLIEKTTFVVGGKGVDRSNDNGGGFSGVTYPGVDYDTFQTATGGPRNVATTWVGIQTACTMTDNGAGYVRVELAGGGVAEFVDCVAGSIVNMYDAANYGMAPQYYVVDLVGPAGQYIDLALAFGVNDTCDINVGGALATLQHALYTVSASNYDMDIHINIDTAAGVTIDDDTFGGNISKNTKRKVIGYHTIPGDMGYGETYYQAPIDSYNDGIDTDCFVGIDAGGGAYSVITVDGRDNTIWENMYLFHTDALGANNAFEVVNTPENIVCINCRFDDVSQIMAAGANNAQFISCGNGPAVGAQPLQLSTGGIILNGVWQESVDSTLGVIGNAVGAVGTFDGNVVIGGDYGIRNRGYLLCKNNVCYNQVKAGIWVANAAAVLTAYNNIGVIQTGGHGILIGTLGGTVAYNDYNCFWSMDDAALAIPVDSDFVGGADPVLGPNSIEANPEFNVAGSDFRLTRQSPCLNAGMISVGGPY